MKILAQFSRRKFLWAFSFLGASYLLSPFGLVRKAFGLEFHREDTGDLYFFAKTLASFFRPKESAYCIGQEYLKLVTNESDISLLVELICSSNPNSKHYLMKIHHKKLRELILTQQRQDFENGEIVNLHGWMLSKTEARICALVRLI